MKNKAYDLSNYNFIKDEILLLDANIWLYLFPAPSSSKNRFISDYSDAFGNMQRAQATIIINALILSEYLNSYCRIEWSALYKSTYRNFKNFRQSPDYLSVGRRAAADAKNILNFCDKKDDDFSLINTNQILDDFELGGIDFNDSLIADSCCRHKWKLVTNDGDFTEGGIEVLTTNPKLLISCL